VVKGHKGWVEVKSEVGNENHGTEFNIYLPEGKKKNITQNRTIDIPDELKIVVIDDEELMLEGIIGYLKKKGFDARGFSKVDEALEYIEKGLPELVILDYYMPDVEGGVVAGRIKKIDERIKIILSTGGDGEELIDDNKHFSGYINKPFTMKQFLETITEILKK
jgi:DNA-binding NtrC family response regulator